MNDEEKLHRAVQRTTAMCAAVAARSLHLQHARAAANRMSDSRAAAALVSEAATAYRTAQSSLAKAVEAEIEANERILVQRMQTEEKEEQDASE